VRSSRDLPLTSIETEAWLLRSSRQEHIVSTYITLMTTLCACDVQWCKVLQHKAIMAPLPRDCCVGKKFRSKELVNNNMFQKVKRALAPALTEEALLQVHHDFWTQKHEFLNKKVTVLVPKVSWRQ
jgi:hypothetical protein